MVSREQSPIRFQPVNGGVIVLTPGTNYFIDATTWDFIVAACPPRSSVPQESGGDRIIRSAKERTEGYEALRQSYDSLRESIIGDLLGRESVPDAGTDTSGDDGEVRGDAPASLADVVDLAAYRETREGPGESPRSGSYLPGQEDPAVSGAMGAGSDESRDVDLDSGCLVHPVSEGVGEERPEQDAERPSGPVATAWNDPAHDDIVDRTHSG